MQFFKNKRVESYEIVMKRLRGKWKGLDIKIIDIFRMIK